MTQESAGTYIYNRNGEEVVLELWHVRVVKDKRTVKSKRISKKFGIQIELNAVETDVWSVYDFEFTDLNSGTVTARGYYRVEHQQVYFSHSHKDDWDLVGIHEKFFPLMRIYTGDLMIQIERAGGVSDVIVPDIRNPADPVSLFKPASSERVVKLDPKIPNLYHYSGGQYKSLIPVTLNERGIMTHYAWIGPNEAKWDCRLDLTCTKKG